MSRGNEGGGCVMLLLIIVMLIGLGFMMAGRMADDRVERQREHELKMEELRLKYEKEKPK